MHNIIQLVYYLLIIVVDFYTGLSVILLSKEDIKNWIPKSFMFGTAGLMLTTFWMSYINQGGLRVGSRIIIIIWLLIATTIGIYKKDTLKKYVKSIQLPDIMCLLVSSIAGMIPLFIIMIYGAQFPYCDGYTYACNADYLLKSGYRILVDPADAILYPWLSQTYLYQSEHFRIGAQMFLALFSGIFNVKFSIELFLPIISFGVFLCGMGSWIFVSDKYAANQNTKIIAVVFMVFNVPIILWNAVYGFLPQVFGSALYIAAVSAILNLMNWKENPRWNIVTTSLLIAGVSLSYNEMLPFFVLLSLIIVLSDFVHNKDERTQIVKGIISCCIITILMIVVYFPGMIKAIFSQFGAVVGWNQEKDMFTYLAYFLSTVPAEYSFQTNEFNMSMNILGLLTLFMFGCIATGFCNTSKDIKRDYIYISLPYMVLLVYFMLISDNPFGEGRGNTWSIYKLAQYYFVVVSPYLALFMGTMLEKRNKLIIKLFIGCFIIFNGYNSIHYIEIISHNMESYVGKTENSFCEYYRLYESYGNQDKRITLYNVPEKHRQMITYFLQDVELVSDWNTDVYFGSIPDVPKELYGSGINLKYDLSNPDNIAGLVSIDTNDVKIYFGEGFYAEEKSGDRYWNWSKKDSELDLIYDAGFNSQIELNFELSVLEQIKESQKLEIYSDQGNVIKVIDINSNETIFEKIIIDPSVQKLMFKYSGSSQIAGKGDQRELAFCIANINTHILDNK